MNLAHRKSVFATLGVAMIWAAVIPAAFAQETSRGSVVVYPVIYSRNSGTKGSRATAVNTVGEVLQKAGYTLISDTVAANTWNRLRIPLPSTGGPSTLAEIVRFGRAMKAHYVVAPVFDFRSRSIWVDLGPRTVSTATVSIVITDIRNERVAFTKKNVRARSDEKFNTVKAVADVLLTPIVTVVSGGPKTPQEQRAVRIAVARALKDWVKSAK